LAIVENLIMPIALFPQVYTKVISFGINATPKVFLWEVVCMYLHRRKILDRKGRFVRWLVLRLIVTPVHLTNQDVNLEKEGALFVVFHQQVHVKVLDMKDVKNHLLQTVLQIYVQ